MDTETTFSNVCSFEVFALTYSDPEDQRLCYRRYVERLKIEQPEEWARREDAHNQMMRNKRSTKREILAVERPISIENPSLNRAGGRCAPAQSLRPGLIHRPRDKPFGSDRLE